MILLMIPVLIHGGATILTPIQKRMQMIYGHSVIQTILSYLRPPILLYQDQWLPPIEELLGYTEECGQRSNFNAIIVSENEIRSTASISVYCDPGNTHSAYYTAHWTR
jgi:hypothetical protein